ncbi:hypothetical protein WDU94_004150 [Cyamophila willieti]
MPTVAQLISVYSSNERNNRTRRHVCGSSAERRFKRSHRRSPFSDEYKDKYTSRSGRHHERSDRDREVEKSHRSDYKSSHHYRNKSPERSHRSNRGDRKRDRRSYSSSQVSEAPPSVLSYLRWAQNVRTD